MDELNIVVNQKTGEITTNFEEVEKALKLQMTAYEDFVVSEDELNVAKGDLAFLRKLRTSIEDRRKEVKKAYLVPYTVFEENCKKLTTLIDEPIKTIDEQLKLFEADRVAKKRERVTKMYEEEMGEYLKYLPVEKNYNEKWNNKSTTDSDILFDISALRLKVKNDIDVIKALDSEIEDELLKTYIKSGNELSAAITRNQQFIADKQRVEVTAKSIVPTEGQQLTTVTQEVSMVADDGVSFVVSKEDAEEVRNLLNIAQIKFKEV